MYTFVFSGLGSRRPEPKYWCFVVRDVLGGRAGGHGRGKPSLNGQLEYLSGFSVITIFPLMFPNDTCDFGQSIILGGLFGLYPLTLSLNQVSFAINFLMDTVYKKTTKVMT